MEKLEELYKITGGNLSKYFFIDDEEELSEIKTLEEQGYVKYVNNGNKRNMYVVTLKLVEKVRGPLEDNDLRIKQRKNFENGDPINEII
jgi:hypothetical protein